MFKLTEDPGTRPEIVSVDGLFTLRDLYYPPRDDESVPLEADMHIVLLDSWQVEDGRHCQPVGGLSVLYARLERKTPIRITVRLSRGMIVADMADTGRKKGVGGGRSEMGIWGESTH